jgi:hypothetical protein
MQVAAFLRLFPRTGDVCTTLAIVKTSLNYPTGMDVSSETGCRFATPVSAIGVASLVTLFVWIYAAWSPRVI